jgi:hypothetical protein
MRAAVARGHISTRVGPSCSTRVGHAEIFAARAAGSDPTAADHDGYAGQNNLRNAHACTSLLRGPYLPPDLFAEGLGAPSVSALVLDYLAYQSRLGFLRQARRLHLVREVDGLERRRPVRLGFDRRLVCRAVVRWLRLGNVPKDGPGIRTPPGPMASRARRGASPERIANPAIAPTNPTRLGGPEILHGPHYSFARPVATLS